MVKKKKQPDQADVCLELINSFLKYVGPAYIGKQSVKDYQHLYNSISLLAKENTDIWLIATDLPKKIRSHNVRRFYIFFLIITSILITCNSLFHWVETGIIMSGRHSGKYDAIAWFELPFFILLYILFDFLLEKRINRTIDLLIQIRDIIKEQKKKPY